VISPIVEHNEGGGQILEQKEPRPSKLLKHLKTATRRGDPRKRGRVRRGREVTSKLSVCWFVHPTIEEMEALISYDQREGENS